MSCATQKSKSDQSGVSKFYHNTTSKFNGYFNANELIEESTAQLSAQYTDNYIDLLELYKYRAAANPESQASNLDEAIKKVSIVATLHENSDWVDDCYLLIGKAFYLKQDFESAQNALEFFMDEFNPDGTRASGAKAKKNAAKRKTTSAKARKEREKTSKQRAKEAEKERKAYNKALKKKQKRSKKSKSSKKKDTGTESGGDEIVVSKRNTGTNPPPPPPKKEKEEKDPNEAAQNPGGIKHRPAYQEAQLWLAKTYIERELYPRAEYHLNSLAGNPYLQDEVAVELPVAQAYYQISRENYPAAIPHLEKAIEVAKKKYDKARYAFIIAQIIELENTTTGKAYAYYEEVLEHAPDYEMAFNARMSMARTAYLSGQASLEQSKGILEKMIRDEKNLEYLDRIYYTYARLYIELDDKESGLIFLDQAAAYTGNNPPLQTEIFFLMGELYFEKKMYVEAKNAYDQALQTMRKDDERYEMTERLSKNLTEIAQHIQTIELQDSLIRISKLSEEERLALAKEIQRAKAIGYASSNQGMGDNAPTGGSGRKGGAGQGLATSAPQVGGPPVRQVVAVNTDQSNFFAYDDKALRRGEREFFREWGGRQLSDNWRAASRVSGLTGVQVTDSGEPVVSEIVTDDQVQQIFRDVPDTPEELMAAQELIQNSMIQLGYLYREKMEEANQSIQVLKELLSKYPDTDKRIEAYYQLYLSYLMLNDISNSNLYKQKIIDEFPGTKYALALSDPDYINKQLSEEQKLQLFYDTVYALVNTDQFSTAFEMIRSGKAAYGTNHEYQPRLALLEAMCIGNLEGREAYIEALKLVVSGYPNTPEETKARDMLLLLGEYKNNRLNLASSGNPVGTGSGSGFKSQPNTVHYMLIMINNFEEVESREAKISISDYNRKYHQLDRLKISSLVFDPSTGQSIILVRSFKNAEDAMKYYENALRHPDEFLPEGAEFEMYPVSQFNYREVIKQRSVEAYRDFFEGEYNKE